MVVGRLATDYLFSTYPVIKDTLGIRICIARKVLIIVNIEKAIENLSWRQMQEDKGSPSSRTGIRIIQKWNLLPIKIKTGPSLNSFKNRLDDMILGTD